MRFGDVPPGERFRFAAGAPAGVRGRAAVRGSDPGPDPGEGAPPGADYFAPDEPGSEWMPGRAYWPVEWSSGGRALRRGLVAVVRRLGRTIGRARVADMALGVTEPDGDERRGVRRLYSDSVAVVRRLILHQAAPRDRARLGRLHHAARRAEERWAWRRLPADVRRAAALQTLQEAHASGNILAGGTDGARLVRALGGREAGRLHVETIRRYQACDRAERQGDRRAAVREGDRAIAAGEAVAHRVEAACVRLGFLSEAPR